VKKNFLELGVKVVFDVWVTNKLVDATRGETEQKTFKTDSSSGFVYGGVGEALLVDLNVANGSTENSFSHGFAGFYGSLDLPGKQCDSLQ